MSSKNRLRLVVKPYSMNGRLFDAYDDVFSMVEESDWVCFTDGDVAFIEMSDFGHLLQEYIDLYPETGMFTCYATRAHCQFQRRKTVDPDVDSIKYYAGKTVEVRKLHPKVKPLKRRANGHLLMLSKATWNRIRPQLVKAAEGKKTLGFDSKLSNTLLKMGYDIKVMRGILVFHYFRFLTGKNEFID